MTVRIYPVIHRSIGLERFRFLFNFHPSPCLWGSDQLPGSSSINYGCSPSFHTTQGFSAQQPLLWNCSPSPDLCHSRFFTISLSHTPAPGDSSSTGTTHHSHFTLFDIASHQTLQPGPPDLLVATFHRFPMIFHRDTQDVIVLHNPRFQLCKLNEFNWSHKQTFNGGAPSATNLLQTHYNAKPISGFLGTLVTMQHSSLPVAQKIDLLHIQPLPIAMLWWGSDRYKHSQQLQVAPMHKPANPQK
eukprot:Gb_11973 [translate_table: standard]